MLGLTRNQNCLFDANEKYDLGTTSNANTATKNSGLKIAIPSDALLGTTILRIVTQKEGSQNSNECQLGFNGEVEDYTIKITPDFTLKSQKPSNIYL
ncbi:GEVED domain-containing protein [Tenacibaculum finnmarkense]|nr:GEVED domain-containing protein [Tenacibaculum finnmarkense]